MLTLKLINKSYGNRTILSDISLSIRKGEIVSILGPSGCGKTTLLNLILGLTQATSGKIMFDGEDLTNVPMQKRGFNIVFQDFALFPNLNAHDNIVYGLRNNPSASTPEEVNELIDLLGLRKHLHQRIDELSGGQKQRLSIARALAKQAPILVLDDSTSALDMETEYEIQNHLAEKKDVSKIIIAHRISSVQSADEILYLDHGRIAERGTHESLMAQKGLYYSTWEAQYGDYHKAKAALEQALPANA